jgi:murein L,D-transpeptidase YafK
VLFFAFAIVPLLVARSSALEIELTGGGEDRLERQKAWTRNELPLPGTPDLKQLPQRLAAQGLKEGLPIFVRIFKAESELELWMQKNGEYVLFATYPICQWSGVLGPKFYEGDNQSPEGFYSVARSQLKWHSRHHRAFDVGFPNVLDKVHGRTGSNILVHGGCSTEGCFAVTNPVMDEIFKLADAALKGGQKAFGVHVFPFRMEAESLARHSDSPWHPFWLDLKTGYDLFQEKRTPPEASICQGRYVFDRAKGGNAAAECDARPLPIATGSLQDGPANGAGRAANVSSKAAEPRSKRRVANRNRRGSDPDSATSPAPSEPLQIAAPL